MILSFNKLSYIFQKKEDEMLNIVLNSVLLDIFIVDFISFNYIHCI